MMTIARSSIAMLLVLSAVSSDLSNAFGNLRTTPRNLRTTPRNLRTTPRNLQTYTQNDDYYSQMLDAINTERSKAGLSSLCTNSKLQAAAKRHSDDMAANNYMAHDGADGSTMSARVTDAGYDWNAVAENVAAGQEDVASVMESWMNSEGHRANILGADYTMVGVSYAYDASTTYKHYWTQDFGAGDSESCDGGTSTSSQTTDQTQQQTQDEVAGEASTSQEYTSAPANTEPATTSPPVTTAPPATTTSPATETPVTEAPTTEAPVATTSTPATQTPGCKAKK